ncbi:MAG: LuxR C-terminal-related transcriptional regulator, partial [bacterium]
MEARAFLTNVNDWGDLSLTTASQVSTAVIRGDFQMAQRYAHEGLALVRRSRYPWAAVLFLPALASARCSQGAWEDAEHALDLLGEPGEVFEEVGLPWRALVWLYRQLLRAHSDGPEAVRSQVGSYLGEALKQARPDIGTLPAFAGLVEIAGILDDASLVEHPAPVLDLALSRGVLFTSGWELLVPRMIGVAASVLRDWEKAEAHFQTAINVANRLGARPELARSRLDYARMLAKRDARGDRAMAAGLVVEAAAAFSELGMEPFWRLSERLAGTLQGKVPPATRERSEYPDGLSDREVEVLRMVAGGHTNQQIADGLVLSVKTVARHISNIFDKTGVDNRSAATAYAFERNLMPLPGAPAAAGTPPTVIAGQEAPAPKPAPAVAVQPRRLLVILFTDMVGSTGLTERLGDANAQEIVRAHNSAVRDCLQRHGGREIKQTGDGIMAAFDSASAAVQCAIDVQTTLSDRTREHPDAPIEVRIGLNAGEPVSEGDDLYG